MKEEVLPFFKKKNSATTAHWLYLVLQLRPFNLNGTELQYHFQSMGWGDVVSVKKKGADPSNLRQPLNIQQRNSKLLKGDSLPKFILTQLWST